MPKTTPKRQDLPDIEKDQKQCFVIMPISSQDGYDEGHFQLVYEDIIKPAIIAAGLSPFRADETKNTNLIQLDILRNVIESPMAICDMSSRNPNVFYELGMRQAFDLPTVLLRDEATVAPFDVNGLRYVTYNKNMKHRDVVLAVAELTIALKDTFEKRDDKSEINSLIRLMDLANPAKLNQVELTSEERFDKLNELHLQKIMSSIESLNINQNIIMNELNRSKFSRVNDLNNKFKRKSFIDRDIMMQDLDEDRNIKQKIQREIQLEIQRGQEEYNKM